jgi:hypothetical protein
MAVRLDASAGQFKRAVNDIVRFLRDPEGRQVADVHPSRIVGI